jgi:hypothetical protein
MKQNFESFRDQDISCSLSRWYADQMLRGLLNYSANFANRSVGSGFEEMFLKWRGMSVLRFLKVKLESCDQRYRSNKHVPL